MRVLLWAVLLGFFIRQTVTAQETTVSTTPGRRVPEQSILYIAQNTQNEEMKKEENAAANEKLPPPPPKIFIATEKPIKGALRGIVGEKKSAGTTAGQSSSTAGSQAGRGQQPGAAKGEQPADTSQQAPVAGKKKSNLVREELSLFNVSTANLRTIKTLIDDDFNLRAAQRHHFPVTG